jgi:hypothetical protein
LLVNNIVPTVPQEDIAQAQAPLYLKFAPLEHTVPQKPLAVFTVPQVHTVQQGRQVVQYARQELIALAHLSKQVVPCILEAQAH